MADFSACLRGVSAAVGLLAALVAAAVGCDDNDAERDIYVTFQTREISTEGHPTVESGCMPVLLRAGGDEFSSASGSAGVGVDEHGDPILPDFSADRTVSDEGLRVLVRSAGQPLELKLYDVVFLGTGRLDRFVVTTRAGSQFEVAHRGAHACDTSDILPSDDLHRSVIAP